MVERFPGYDVLAARDTLAWNDRTREAIAERLALQVPEGVLDAALLATLRRLVGRLCPDPEGRPPTTTLAMVVRMIAEDAGEGFRHHRLPRTRECWLRGLDALEAEARARYDGVLCMYHDQALIPVKMLDFWGGVNITLGLPIVRTSPDHGTGFDIAGRGLARPDSLIAAIRLAAEIAERRGA